MLIWQALDLEKKDKRLSKRLVEKIIPVNRLLILVITLITSLLRVQQIF